MSTKIKRDGKYFAFADYCGQWYPFWNDEDIPDDIKKSMIRGQEYIIEKEVSFTNCGAAYKDGNNTWYTPCSGLWPNPACGHCGGYGVGARFD